MLRLGIKTLINCIEPPSYARTAYVVAIWPSFLFDSFVKIWATCQIFLGKWFTAPPGKKFPVRLSKNGNPLLFPVTQARYWGVGGGGHGKVGYFWEL